MDWLIFIRLWLPWILAALLVSVLVAGSRRSGPHKPTAASRVDSVIAVAALALVALWMGAMAAHRGLSDALWEARFGYPIMCGVVAVVVLLVSYRGASPGATVDLTPRHVWTFAPRSAFIGLGAALTLMVVLALTAGGVSEPDEAGAYRVFNVSFGEATTRVEIYGWHYSVPALALALFMVAGLYVYMRRIARPAWGSDRDADQTARFGRGRNAVLIASGALLLHLGFVFQSLSATSSVRIEIEGDTNLSTGTTFAALAEALAFMGLAATTAGLACWMYVAVRGMLVTSRPAAQS
ncbi:hypothetical protein [Microbacterium sp. Ru50]|uniref:hypothetical protein n=1 Tax=Microbacterium sp. Ru50 TaxID=2080744 RepID=UPI0011AEE545|nr:hypothetical protein [Microbacterium sp. Ru50]